MKTKMLASLWTFESIKILSHVNGINEKFYVNHMSTKI
jgi:hypothetical protein